MEKTVNILIIHYNTPVLTEHLIKSINKFTPNSRIYIFDNSDKETFEIKQENITYFDNTKGRIINFDKWLQNYPNRHKSGGRLNKWGSAKHAYTVEKCISLIPDGFILLDSDVLLKRDISELFDEKYVYVGEDITQSKSTIKRVAPFVCYINSKLCREKGIHYFNENYMHGLFCTKVNKHADSYDTGAAFFLSAKNTPSRKIKWENYVTHYGSASWRDGKGGDAAKRWLTRNESLWQMNYEHPDFAKEITRLQGMMKRFGLSDNILNPQTIQEKIQWLKIFDSSLLKTKCADKIRVHEYCREKLGTDICIPILKTYSKASDIKWDELPQKFVLKCNHGSGMNIVVKDKNGLNKADAINRLNKWMATDFAFQNGYEFHYHDIPRKIFVEEYKEDSTQKSSLFDYKFWCFNGTPKFMTINDGQGHGKMAFFNAKFEKMDVERVGFAPLPNPVKPLNFGKMIEYAGKLSEDFKFVRVDFYEINGEVFLGEMTFTPGSGFFNYTDKKYDKIFGDMLDLKNKKVIYTCITGNYEPLDDPFVISSGFDYVCFTDSNTIKSDIWKIRPIPSELNGLSAVKKQRCIKVNAHKYLSEYDLSIWVDGSVKLKGDANQFIEEKCGDSSISIFVPKHPSRNCIYDEMNTCIRMKKDTAEHIEPQRKRYLAEGFPKKYGLVQSNIMVRRHNSPDCIKVMTAWWAEIEKGSHRDQLSFNYAMWKNQDVKMAYLDKTTCCSKWFKWDPLHGRGLKRHKIAAPQPEETVQIVGLPVRKKTAPPRRPLVYTNSAMRSKMLTAQLKSFLRP